jgi:hypothetical protein
MFRRMYRIVLRTVVIGLAGVILGGTMAALPAGADDVGVTAGCDNHPGVPDWFYPTLQRAAENPDDAVPNSWAEGDRGRAMMKIICNESSFDVGALNPAGPYYGLGQMGRPAIDASRVRFTCYWHVNNDCSHLRRYYQALAALRYANQRYGGPLPAWAHWQSHGWW